MPSRFSSLTRSQTAAWIGVGVGMLDSWRATGTGPAYVELPGKTSHGTPRIRYRLEDLETWLTEARSSERGLPPLRTGPKEGAVYGRRFRFRPDPSQQFVSDEQAARDFVRHVLTPPEGPALGRRFVHDAGEAVIAFVKTLIPPTR